MKCPKCDKVISTVEHEDFNICTDGPDAVAYICPECSVIINIKQDPWDKDIHAKLDEILRLLKKQQGD